jgi:hypothetical protein
MMNDQLEKWCEEFRAELGALRKKLEELETKQSGSNVGASFTTRRIFFRRRAAALLSAAMLLAAVGLLHGQGAGDALFIDPKGWVGLGTNSPKAMLDVAGSANLSSATIEGSLKAGTLNVTKDTILANTTIKGSLTSEGKGTISNVFVGDVGHGQDWAGFSHRNSTTTTGYGFLHHTSGQYALINKKSGGGGFIGFRIDNADKMVVADNGSVGIGTTTPDPKAKLDVVGAIKATSVNGEKPPLVFEVGQKGDTQKWHSVNQDIGALCGDADGCTMKFFLRENSTDRVLTISEQIYIEQPDKSNNRTAGLRGHARQLGGGDSEFILQTANKYEIVPHPWDWIYVRNYQSPEVGAQSNAFGGYQVQFMTRPNVSATVIIYDR